MLEGQIAPILLGDDDRRARVVQALTHVAGRCVHVELCQNPCLEVMKASSPIVVVQASVGADDALVRIVGQPDAGLPSGRCISEVEGLRIGVLRATFDGERLDFESCGRWRRTAEAGGEQTERQEYGCRFRPTAEDGSSQHVIFR